MRPIYLDYNATTPLLPAVWEAMRPYACETYGNAASAHFSGRAARRALEDARECIASLLDAYPDEVIFTSGATESNNLAIFGLAGETPSHVVTSPLEHPSVSEPLSRLASRGFAITHLPVTTTGIVATDSPLTTHHSPLTTRLLCVMHANHETGAVQPIRALAHQAGEQVRFHCDAAATAGKIPVDFHALGVSTLALSAHKFHGPKGIGALLVRRGTSLPPLLWGGHQQQGRRPGTEAVALIVGMARALELACEEQDAKRSHVLNLRERFLHVVHEAGQPFVVNGPTQAPDKVLPHTLNVSFPGCHADALLINFDLAGIACSTGSACSSGSLLPSPVLQAMNVPEDVLHSAMRFSFSYLQSESEVTEAAHRIVEVVRRLRRTPE